MKLTVLGKYGPFPGAGGACSGYLIENGQTKVLLDCGNGVLSRLQQICPVHELSAIVLSHLHSDHMSDMMVLRYALDIWTMKGMREDIPLPVYTPQNPQEEFSRLDFKNVFGLNPIQDGMRAVIGTLSFTFHEMTHPVQSFGMEISDGLKRFVYTGDTNMNPSIEVMAKGADFFLAETGLLDRDKSNSQAPHLSAREAGVIARDAGVKKLMITHFWPGYDEEEILSEAASVFEGALKAQEMKDYQI